MCLPFRGRSVVCPHRCCWNAPEFGVGFLRFLHCPELFSECKKGCRLEFCTLPRHCIHSALSHCSGPKNLGNQMKERENMTTQLKFQSAGTRGDEKRDREVLNRANLWLVVMEEEISKWNQQTSLKPLVLAPQAPPQYCLQYWLIFVLISFRLFHCPLGTYTKTDWGLRDMKRRGRGGEMYIDIGMEGKENLEGIKLFFTGSLW